MVWFWSIPTVTIKGKIQVLYASSPAQHYILLCKTLRNNDNREGAACKKEREIFKTQHIKAAVVIVFVGNSIGVLLFI